MPKELESAHVYGWAKLPTEYCELVLLYHVIDQALTEAEALT